MIRDFTVADDGAVRQLILGELRERWGESYDPQFNPDIGEVSTDTPWASAIALYWSCGFVEVGRDQTDTHFALTLLDQLNTKPS